MKIGYVRVSTDDQNLEVQKSFLNVDKFFEDTWSGKDTIRPGFKEMMEYIRDGDILVVHRLDRLSRNLNDLLNIINNLLEKNVQIEFVSERIFLSKNPTPMQILQLAMLGAFAEFERNVNLERQRCGIALAKKKGAFKGRQPRFTNDLFKQIEKMNSEGCTKKTISKYLGISKSSVYNYLAIKGPATRENLALLKNKNEGATSGRMSAPSHSTMISLTNEI